MSRSRDAADNHKGDKKMLCNLKAEMARQGIMCKDLANLLGINPATVSAKISCKSQFTFEEAQKIQRGFFPALELQYLFKEGAL